MQNFRSYEQLDATVKLTNLTLFWLNACLASGKKVCRQSNDVYILNPPKRNGTSRRNTKPTVFWMSGREGRRGRWKNNALKILNGEITTFTNEILEYILTAQFFDVNFCYLNYSRSHPKIVLGSGRIYFSNAFWKGVTRSEIL